MQRAMEIYNEIECVSAVVFVVLFFVLLVLHYDIFKNDCVILENSTASK